MTVGIVTDSTAYLPEGALRDVAGETVPASVVPLSVLVDHDSYAEGADRPEGELGRALARAGGATTSRPSPATFLTRYERLAAAGATEIVSVHLSGALSGTYDSAVLAARVAPVRVEVVDSGVMGMALGFAVLDAAACLRHGGNAAEAARTAQRTADGSEVRFVVNSLEFLRRGGRIGAASAWMGSALAVKPILELSGGRIAPVEKQRTLSRALARMAELAEERISMLPRARVAVQHVAAPGRAAEFASQLGRQYGDLLAADPSVVEMGLVAAAHLGPGSIGVVVAPAADEVKQFPV